MYGLPPILILAGGLGTRLAGVAGGLPKSMVPVLGKPFIEHQLNWLKKQRAGQIILCVGHRQTELRDFVGDGSRFALSVQYSSDGEQLLGTGGAVVKAAKLTGSPFAVLYGDSYLEAELAPIVESFERSGKKALMSVYRNENQSIPSNLLVEGGKVVCYDKVNPSPEMKHVDYGFSVFTAAALDGFEHTVTFDLNEVFQSLIKDGQLACQEVAEQFHEVGSPQGLAELESYLSKPGKGR